MLKVTRVWPHEYKSGKLLGFADIELSLDGSDSRHMTWRGLKVFQGDDKIEVRLPSRKDDNGKKDEQGRLIYHPVIQIPNFEDNPNPQGAELMEGIRIAVAEAYQGLGSKSESSSPSQNNVDTIEKDKLPF